MDQFLLGLTLEDQQAFFGKLLIEIDIRPRHVHSLLFQNNTNIGRCIQQAVYVYRNATNGLREITLHFPLDTKGREIIIWFRERGKVRIGSGRASGVCGAPISGYSVMPGWISRPKQPGQRPPTSGYCGYLQEEF